MYIKDKIIKKPLMVILVTLCIFGTTPGILLAEPNEPTESIDYFEMDIEKLMEVEVVSASRQPTSQKMLSAPVTIITSEDIHYSGMTSIPEILQFTLGVDVRRQDRQRYIVGIRGLFGDVSDRTLILINGRPVTDPIFGTTHWEQIPVLMEEIERIEVVRSPVGAAWGANAFTGVINIITKKPDQLLGGLVSTTVTEFGDTYNSLIYGQQQDKWSWKVSAGYDDVKDSDTAGAGKYHLAGHSLSVTDIEGYNARDWGRFYKFNTQAEYRADDQSRWSFGASHSSSQEGDFEFVGYYPRRDILTEYTQLFTRFDHKFDKDTSGYIQWFGNSWNTHCRVLTDHMQYLQNDIEGQINFKPAENHTISTGGNFRWNRIRTDVSSSFYENNLGDVDEYWGGIFLMDSWSVTDRLTLEGQGRVDNYSETSKDWSVRFAALYALDEKQNHILRAGFARAFRSPSLLLRNVNSVFSGSIFVLAPTPDIHNEESYALETGYSGKLSNNLQLNVDGYYQRFEQLIGFVLTPDPPPPPLYYGTFLNIDGANSFGGEFSLTYQKSKIRLKTWYAYNGFETDQKDQSTRAFPPASHKAGLTGRVFLDDKWTVNSNYVFQNGVKYDQGLTEGLKTYHRWDLTLSRKLAQERGEFMIGVSDLLNETQNPVYGAGHLTALETPGRTFFASVKMKF